MIETIARRHKLFSVLICISYRSELGQPFGTTETRTTVEVEIVMMIAEKSTPRLPFAELPSKILPVVAAFLNVGDLMVFDYVPYDTALRRHEER